MSACAVHSALPFDWIKETNEIGWGQPTLHLGRCSVRCPQRILRRLTG